VKRHAILSCIQGIGNAEENYKAIQADPSTSFDQRTGARRAFERAQLDFIKQWQNVRDLLALFDRLEKWFNANSEMRSMGVLEGESLRWHVRLKEIVLTGEGEDIVAMFEAGTYEDALDGALKIVEV
jgi:hypothetical protein